jgi:hypothetical protein
MVRTALYQAAHVLMHPGEYPDGLVRTVQRRLKIWRSALAHALVFGRDLGASGCPAACNMDPR